MSGYYKTSLPKEEGIQTLQTKHPERWEAAVIIEELRNQVIKEIVPLLIPYHQGLRILRNVSDYLTGYYQGTMSWTLTFFKHLEAQEVIKKEKEKENASRTS